LNGNANIITNGSASSVTINGTANKICGGGYNFIGNGSCNTVVNSSSSTILNGACNFVCAIESTILGGSCNTLKGVGVNPTTFSTIGNGCRNTINSSSGYNTIGGGINNKILFNSCLSQILGGENNRLENDDKSFIIGSDITSNRACTTFVNNLSIMDIPTSTTGLPSKSVWRCTTDNTLRIVP
jgi:hypothetical protein